MTQQTGNSVSVFNIGGLPDRTDAELLLQNYQLTQLELKACQADLDDKTIQRDTILNLINGFEGLISINELDEYYTRNKQYEVALKKQESVTTDFQQVEREVKALLVNFPGKLFAFRVPNGTIQSGSEQADKYSAMFSGDGIITERI